MKQSTKILLSLVLVLDLAAFAMATQDLSEADSRQKKVLPIFQVVTFPNDPCDGDSTRNGTCYTAEECSNRGGSNTGSCAEGFGVCCAFVVGCGSSISENCTYFTGTNLQDGACTTRVCKCSSNICQIRLDFNTFLLTGPSTRTVSIGKVAAGLLIPDAGNGIAVSESGRCLTDTFTIGNQDTVPVICGTNSGEHVYYDAADECNDMSFQFGSTLLGQDAKASRQFDIKITQISCTSELLAPSGCTQYFTGAGPAHVKTFNFDGDRHLANQDQTICVRRANGFCTLCWVADATTDVQVTGDAPSMGVLDDKDCCGYGTGGSRAVPTGGGDCIMIPGAIKTDNTIIPVTQCGNGLGLITATDTGGKTICTMSVPFRVRFKSDTYEFATDAADEGGSTGNTLMKGVKLRYTQTSC